MSKIGLKEAISGLRTEVVAAMEEATDEDLKFELGDIEMEFQVAIEKAATVGAKAKFWIFAEAGVEGSHSHIKTHTIKLSLKPLLNGKGAVFLEGEQPD